MIGLCKMVIFHQKNFTNFIKMVQCGRSVIDGTAKENG